MITFRRRLQFCCTWILATIVAALGEDSGEIYDVLVYGATPSGIMASVAAARLLRNKQQKVLLLNPTTHIGGMVSGGLGQTDIGFDPDRVIGGLAREFFEKVAAYYEAKSIFQPRKPWNVEPHVADIIFWELLDEAGVEVTVGVGHVQNVQVQNHTTISMIQTIRHNSSTWWKAKVFVDASYEGDLMKMAGTPFAIGREAKTTYGESYAGNRGHNDGHVFPVAVNPYLDDRNQTLLPYLLTPSPEGSIGDADEKIQSYNFRLCVTNRTENKIPFDKPSNYEPARWELLRRYITKLVSLNNTHHYIKVPTPNLSPLANGKFDCNNGGPISTDFVGGSWAYPFASYAEREQIWEAHKQYTLELFWFLKTDASVPIDIRNEMNEWGLCADEFLSTNHWPPQLYVREVIRMAGEQVFTQESIEEQSNIDIGLESIGLGSYRYDSHTAQRVPSLSKDTNEVRTKNEGDLQQSPHPSIYQIPFWVVIPPKLSNLLVSVCVRASHVAYSSLRMEPQFMIMGQAAGTIAAMRTNGTSVQELDLEVLRKQLLELKQQVSVLRPVNDGIKDQETANSLKE